MGGVYRKIMYRPTDVSYSVVHYDDPNFELGLSDQDRLAGRTLPDPPATGRYTALQLAFTLAASTYATMALREVLKSDTASSSQRALTEDMNAQHARTIEGEAAAGEDAGDKEAGGVVVV
jgi:tRNA pseudouridine13 synthase